jgi:serine protease Do
LNSGYYYNAKVVGFCEAEDLALIKIEGTHFPAAKIGNSLSLKVGEKTVVVGNPGGMDAPFSTMEGIVSALDRKVLVDMGNYGVELSMIQTSAPVSHGNSGGPLFNAKGEVIGIITRKRTTYEGMSYAIPITDAMRTVNAILAGELEGFVSTVSKSRPKIGITGTNIARGERFTLGGREYTAPAPGFFVIEVSANTAAYGKIEIGDILCSVNGVTVTDMDSFKNELYKCYVGQNVTFEIYRRGQKITVQIVIGVS